MSNKIVPATYRAIIDDVIASIKSEFDDHGVREEVLAELQTKWENKVIASHVADFEQAAPPNLGYATHPLHGVSGPQAHYPVYIQPPPPPPPQHPLIKTEPSESRYILSTPTAPPYSLPPLPGPQLNGIYRPSATPAPAANNPSTYQNPSLTNGTARQSYPAPSQPAQPINGQPQSQPQQPRVPQVDGPSSSSSESSSPPPSLAPRSTHPSLMSSNPQSSPKQGENEEINSDLDDSDSDAEEEDQEGVTGETDIVFCTYDKVARVKNKWKCVLKDGMIHINGKDYLFAKCNCEFEW